MLEAVERYHERGHLPFIPPGHKQGRGVDPRVLDVLGADAVAEALDRAPDAAGMLLITPTDYGTCADIRSVATLCHDRGKTLIVDEAWGAHLPFHPDRPARAMDAGADLCVTSVHKMGAGLEQGSVYHLRGDRVDPDLAAHAPDPPRAARVDVPDPGELELEQAVLPREAFFADAEHVPPERAVGRVCAETISPCPPGVPAALPGEVITQPVVDYLRSGRDAGMYLPDPTDSDLETVRVVTRP
ncbi:Orn/Lys/Arg decarboxylase domain protein [Actinosynnema mirum DSM 43827]|uniref:Orn/Lys/Arg decarboxylase domain protein n=1 Tax=Actinosynnema mirum (strain ATCC 29888 / DSM 43827 / JCM 3225 / NBRC 14064 / NCIMB 13271 / NRRL B-12336 / IMRU 3971 / 101) TaxID=446462 RepID=C6WIR4_ACTMD|nr:Orn/Lys/Arg decarboxylase domain protein [Actinosynnema mirum DSM 43827]